MISLQNGRVPNPAINLLAVCLYYGQRHPFHRIPNYLYSIPSGTFSRQVE